MAIILDAVGVTKSVVSVSMGKAGIHSISGEHRFMDPQMNTDEHSKTKGGLQSIRTITATKRS